MNEKLLLGPLLAVLIFTCLIQGAPPRMEWNGMSGLEWNGISGFGRNYGCFGYLFSFACNESSTTESPSRVTTTTTLTSIPGDILLLLELPS